MYDQVIALQKYFTNHVAMQNKVILNIYNFICTNLHSTYVQANFVRSKVMNYDFFTLLFNSFTTNSIYLKFLFLIILFLFIIFIDKKNKIILLIKKK